MTSTQDEGAEVQRWHRFHNGQANPYFGQGTGRQAMRYLKRRNAHLVADHYKLTTLDEKEELPDSALVVDLDTGDFRPERHRRAAAHSR